MTDHQLDGGCICGACRYQVTGAPDHVTICHCTFCQRATGSAFMIEPIFSASQLAVTSGVLQTHSVRSAGSGKQVHIHFCERCGTKTHLSFERFPDAIGLYIGTLDNPDALEVSDMNSYHIFLDNARPGTLIPAGVKTYRQHAFTSRGEKNEATIYTDPHIIP